MLVREELVAEMMLARLDNVMSKEVERSSGSPTENLDDFWDGVMSDVAVLRKLTCRCKKMCMTDNIRNQIETKKKKR